MTTEEKYIIRGEILTEEKNGGRELKTARKHRTWSEKEKDIDNPSVRKQENNPRKHQEGKTINEEEEEEEETRVQGNGSSEEKEQKGA